MTRALLIFISVLGLAHAGCGSKSHPPNEPVDAGPADAGSTRPRVDSGPSSIATCARQCEACAPTFGVTVQQCVEGCEARHRVAVENSCEDRFVGWSDCIADACDEVDRCNDMWRGARRSCF